MIKAEETGPIRNTSPDTSPAQTMTGVGMNMLMHAASVAMYSLR